MSFCYSNFVSYTSDQDYLDDYYYANFLREDGDMADFDEDRYLERLDRLAG